MPLDLPESTAVLGSIEIALVLKDDGDTGMVYGYDGVNATEAIGYLTVVLDRMREQERLAWGDCPVCGDPLDEHDLDEDDEEDER